MKMCSNRTNADVYSGQLSIFMGVPYVVVMAAAIVVSLTTEAQGQRLPPSGAAGPRGSLPGGFIPFRPRVTPPSDVTTITINDTTVGLCKKRHFCDSLGCQAPSDASAPLCYCDPDCVFFDDCCYDYPSCRHWEGNRGPSAENNFTEEIEPRNLTCITPTRTSSSYYLVSTCSPENTDVQTAVRCEEPASDDNLAIIPCYGKNSSVHYRNIYCALCNGEDIFNLVPWTVLVNCDEPSKNDVAVGFLQTSIANLRRVEEELGCHVVVQVPDVMLPPRYCYPNAVRHCPTREHALSDACESYTSITKTDVGREKLYKNPHCALCNLPYRPDPRIGFATDCKKEPPVFYLNVPVDDSFLRPNNRPGLGGPGGSGVDGGLGNPGPPERPKPRPQPPPPISILFDFRSDSSVKIVQNSEVLVTEAVQCPPNEVYDPFVSRCRRLSCSKGYLLKGDHCIPDFQVFGHACGDSDTDDDIDVGVTLSLGSACQHGLSHHDNDTHLLEDIQLCLADFLGRDHRSLEEITSDPAVPTDCPGVARYSFSVNATGESLVDFRNSLRLSLPSSEACKTLDLDETWSVVLSQNCANLPVDKCDGRWLNNTDVSFPSANGTTLVYVNASESWYTLNQTIIRANFWRKKTEFEQYTDVQICADPILTCPLVLLNSSLFEDDENNPGSIIYAPEGNVFSRDEYIRTENGEIHVCSFLEKNGTRNGTTSAPFFDFSPSQQVLSLIGNIVSMVASVITFITYCVFKELRKRVSLAIMALVACLFSGQLLLLVSGSATANPSACTAVAALGHFFWLSTVFWTGVLAFGLNRVFASANRIRRLHADPNVFFQQSLFAFGTSFLIVLPCLIIHLCDCTDVPLSYGREGVCWIGNGHVGLVTFGAPIGVTVIVNVVLFAFTIRGIHTAKRQAKSIKQTDESEIQRMKKELFIYIKISSLMGFTWIFGFAAALSDVIVLWYIFIILNSCQGLLIFLSFICNRKVLNMWKALVCAGDAETTSVSKSTSREMTKLKTTSLSSHNTYQV